MSPGSGFGFPKSVRILRRSEYRKVYDEGLRQSGPLFTAFCLRRPDEDGGPRVGFTVPRTQGKSVVRNRMKRRMREAVRLHLAELNGPWSIVFNPRRAILAAPFPSIESEVSRAFRRCVNS